MRAGIPPQASRGRSSWLRFGPAAVVTAWTALALATIDLRGWWFTELPTLRCGDMSFAGMLVDRAAHGHCPLYFSLSWLIQRLGGDTTVWLRLPAVAAGTAALVLVAVIARKTIGDGGGLVATTIFAFNPLFLHVSQLARPYSLALLLGLASVLILIGGEGSTKDAWRFGFVTLLGLWNSYVHFFVLVPEMGWLLIRRRPRWRAAAGGFSGIVVSLVWTAFTFLYVPRVAGDLEHLTWMGPTTFDSIAALPTRLAFGIEPFNLGPGSPGIEWVSIAVLGVVLVGAWAIIRGRLEGRGEERLLILAVGFGGVATGLVCGLLGWGDLAWVPRYFIVSSACLAIVVAAGLSRSYILRGLAMSIAVLVGGGAGGMYLAKQGSDVSRQAARTILDEGSESERIVLIGDHNMVMMIRYYLQQPIIWAKVGTTKRTDPMAGSDAGPRIAGKYRGAWIFLDKDAWIFDAETKNKVFDAIAFVDSLNGRFPMRRDVDLGGHLLIHCWRPVNRP